MEKFSDYQLVQKSLKSPDFFGEIISRYEEKISRFLLRLGAKEKEEREDLLQEIFLKAYTHLNDIEKDLSFSAWIYRIARNTLYDGHRKKESRGKKLELSDEESKIFWNAMPDLSQDIEGDFDTKILQKFIREKIANLPQIKRDIFILFFLEEKSYEEISDILHLNQNSIATHISRGKKLLKSMIENDKNAPITP